LYSFKPALRNIDEGILGHFIGYKVQDFFRELPRARFEMAAAMVLTEIAFTIAIGALNLIGFVCPYEKLDG
jgi:hypothetical protein